MALESFSYIPGKSLGEKGMLKTEYFKQKYTLEFSIR